MDEKGPDKKARAVDAVKPVTFPKQAKPKTAKSAPVEEESAEDAAILDKIEQEVNEEMAGNVPDPAESTPLEPEAPVEPEPAPESETPTEPEPTAEQPQPEQPAETPEPSIQGLDDEQQPGAAPGLNENKPSFADQLNQTNENQNPTEPPRATLKKERKIFKFIRIFIWLFVAIMLPVSIFVMRHSETPAAYANNTHDAQLTFGQIFFWITIIVGAINLIWGAVRWIMRIIRNQCKAGRIIGKLIGGGIWRFFVFAAIVLLSLTFIAPAINNKIRSNVMDQYKQVVDGRTAMSDDFAAGNITVDQYIKYSLDYMFAPDNLPDQYKEGSENVFFDLDEALISEHLDELSDETVESLAEALLLSNINIDTDASGNVSKYTSADPLIKNVSAANTKSTKTLNKAKVSPKGTAVIFYTDTGTDAVSDEVAEGIGRVMDNVVDKTKEIFGIDYQYKVTYTENADSLEKVKKVLKANNIDENALDTMGVVYVADPTSKGSALKAYHKRPFLEEEKEESLTKKIRTRLDAKIQGTDYGYSFWDSTPVDEFTVIKPEYAYLENGNLALNTEEVISHEFAHGIQWSYCRDTIGKYCTAQYLSKEGTAHLFAINAMSSHAADSLLANDHNEYIQNSCNRLENIKLEGTDLEYGCNAIGKHLGYPTLAFWENYYEIVPNAASIAVQSWTQENTINYLYEQAGATNFRNVMKQLSQRNVTNDYKDSIKNALTAKAYPNGTTLYCGGLCTEKYSMAPTSLKYIYLNTEDHEETKISVQAPNSTAISFIKLDSSKQILKEGNGKVEYTLNKSTGVIVIAVANSSLDAIDFIVSVTTNNLEDLIEKVDIDFTTNNPFKEMNNGCVELDVDGLADSISEISGFVKGIKSDMVDLSFATNELEKAEANAEEMEENLKGNKITICSNKVKDDIDFATARAKLKEALVIKPKLFSLDLSFLDKNEADFKLSVFCGINALDQSGRIFVLTNAGGANAGDLMLFNINVTKK